jgi:hypothetical protein
MCFELTHCQEHVNFMRDAVTSIKRGIDDVGEKVDHGFQVCVQRIYCLRFDY